MEIAVAGQRFLNDEILGTIFIELVVSQIRLVLRLQSKWEAFFYSVVIMRSEGNLAFSLDG